MIERHYRTYVIRCSGTGHLKIGGSTNVAKRVRDLTTGAPFPLEVICTLNVDEDDAQQANAEDCVHGEWFRPTPEVCSYIVQHMTALEAPPARKPRRTADLDDYRDARAIEQEPINIYEQLELAGLGLAPPIDLSWLPEHLRPKPTVTGEEEASRA